ncbi:hypothetical protein MPTK1_5g19460 [Marchantia polymorpha subsp. ruderalis]|uniref:NAD(P)-binding domain-containing protein n=2 Tax=Marchantia polymorpha TaxID=3197 RepID=A0A176VJ11_MARPO|nr:hypothetical protein AXG93_4905s1030 [Marchantia polymorpha subsp. ruderalis]PTQ29787.1 hypothetical protein MARPO_0134s0004 [Marchantia polymorpha]BBN12364.1 hypothetical protein Mp_5g19460 [Marchantia polymorpha subsp. ruderalis]|eukprot:PTQ29787.1 hypothetical protein MARPO_0134s0004 [Marchantia polymorpha]
MAAVSAVSATVPGVASLCAGQRQSGRCSAAAAELAVPREHSSTKWSCSISRSGARSSGMLGIPLQAANTLSTSRVSKQHRRSSVTRCMEAEEPTVDNSTVLVVGGGGVGLETIKALSMAGSWITGYQRSDKFRKDIEGLGAMLAIGDVLDTATIEKTLKSNSFDAIVCTVGGGTTDPNVDQQGPINLVDAAKKAGVKRFILISSVGVGDSRQAVDERTIQVLLKVLEAKEVAEDYVKQSGLEWTIIRPGGLLSSAPPSGKGVLTENLTVAGLIHRTDVASLVLKIIFDKRTYSKTYTAIDAEKVMPPGRSMDGIEFLSLA